MLVANRVGRGYSFEALQAKILFAEGAREPSQPPFEPADPAPRQVPYPHYSPLMGNAVFTVFGNLGIVCRGSRPVRVSRNATISRTWVAVTALLSSTRAMTRTA